MEVGDQRHAPASLPPGKTHYPLYRRLGGPYGRSEQLRKISPSTEIRSPDRPARSESLYRLSYPGPLRYNVSSTFLVCPHFCACLIKGGMFRPSAVSRASFYTAQKTRAVCLDRRLSEPPDFDECRNVSTNVPRTKLHENLSGVNRGWTDGRTDGRTNGRTNGRMTRLCERAKWKKERDEVQVHWKHFFYPGRNLDFLYILNNCGCQSLKPKADSLCQY